MMGPDWSEVDTRAAPPVRPFRHRTGALALVDPVHNTPGGPLTWQARHGAIPARGTCWSIWSSATQVPNPAAIFMPA